MGIVAGGKTQISANTGSIATGDNIASYLVDSAGTLLTSQSGKLDVYPVTTYLEDSPHTTGDFGGLALAIRNDAGTSLVSADGDYSGLSVDSTGKLWTSSSLPASQNFALAEDTAVSSGQVLAMIGAVRADVAGSQVSADGDAAWFQTNAVGEIRVINKSETAILQQVITVGTTAVQLPAASLANRKSLMVQMLSGGQLYVGSATVTSSGATRGVQLGKGGFVNFDVGPSVAVYGIADAAGKDVAVLEMS